MGEQEKQTIHKIKSKIAEIVTSPEEVNESFRDFDRRL